MKPDQPPAPQYLHRYSCAPAEGDYNAGMEHCSDGDYVEYEAAMSAMEELAAGLKEAMISHNQCEDTWYACPKSPDGCADDRAGTACNCGADEHNKAIVALLKKWGLE